MGEAARDYSLDEVVAAYRTLSPSDRESFELLREKAIVDEIKRRDREMDNGAGLTMNQMESFKGL